MADCQREADCGAGCHGNQPARNDGRTIFVFDQTVPVTHPRQELTNPIQENKDFGQAYFSIQQTDGAPDSVHLPDIGYVRPYGSVLPNGDDLPMQSNGGVTIHRDIHVRPQQKCGIQETGQDQPNDASRQQGERPKDHLLQRKLSDSDVSMESEEGDTSGKGHAIDKEVVSAAMMELKERLQTYENAPGIFPTHGQLCPESLSHLGLLYIGPGDKVCCFCCKLELRDWKSNDDPVAEHIKWGGICQHLKDTVEPEVLRAYELANGRKEGTPTIEKPDVPEWQQAQNETAPKMPSMNSSCGAIGYTFPNKPIYHGQAPNMQLTNHINAVLPPTFGQPQGQLDQGYTFSNQPTYHGQAPNIQLTNHINAVLPPTFGQPQSQLGQGYTFSNQPTYHGQAPNMQLTNHINAVLPPTFGQPQSQLGQGYFFQNQPTNHEQAHHVNAVPQHGQPQGQRGQGTALFNCPLCKQKQVDHTQITCGHNICSQCVRKLDVTTPRQEDRKCGVCGREVVGYAPFCPGC